MTRKQRSFRVSECRNKTASTRKVTKEIWSLLQEAEKNELKSLGFKGKL